MQTTTALRNTTVPKERIDSAAPSASPPIASAPIAVLPRGSAMGRAPLDADASDTSDLIAILIGGDARRARSQAGAILARSELVALARASPDHLAHETGLPRLAVRRICAAFALGRRAARAPRAVRSAMRSPTLVHELMASELSGLEQETFHVLLLDGKHRLKRRQRVSEGTLTTSLVHPREVFGPALRDGAAALICVHNHPSGDPEPSREDLEVTRRLIEAGRLLGVPLLDHVVVADEGFVSLRERMSFET